MRRFILMTVGLGLLAGASGAAKAKDYTDDEVAEMIKRAPSSQQYPQAGAMVLLQQKVIRYNLDRSAETGEHLVVKILQDRGKYAYGDIKRKYDKDSDSMVVVKAVTHLTDGSILPVEAKAINDITPAELANASIYANIMQKVISFPGIEPGVSIELKLKTFSKAPEAGEETFVWGTDLFQGDNPIFRKELLLTVPESINIVSTVQNEGLDYSTSQESGFITHIWTAEHSPQIINEQKMPIIERIAPRLIYTSAQSWEQVASWYAKKFYSHVKTDGSIKEKADELTRGAKSRDEKIERLALHVITDVRDVGEGSLPLGIAGYEPHDADVVLANAYGDWRDKSVLAVALLQAAGIECYPAFVNARDPEFAEQHPALKQFDAILVYVPDYKGQPFWVNSFADHTPFGYIPHGQGTTAFVVRPDGSSLVKVVDYPAEANLATNEMKLVLKSNGDVEGSVQCKVAGYFDYLCRIDLKDDTPKEREQFFLTSANAISEGGKSINYKMSNLNDLEEPVTVVQNFMAPELGIVQGDMMIFHVPAPPYSFSGIPAFPSDIVRNYDYALNYQMLVENEGRVALPRGYKAVFIAPPVSLENKFGRWESEYKLSEDGKSLSFNSTIKLVDKTIDTEEYSEFKKAFDDFASPKNSLILLEREKVQ